MMTEEQLQLEIIYSLRRLNEIVDAEARRRNEQHSDIHDRSKDIENELKNIRSELKTLSETIKKQELTPEKLLEAVRKVFDEIRAGLFLRAQGVDAWPHVEGILPMVPRPPTPTPPPVVPAVEEDEKEDITGRIEIDSKGEIHGWLKNVSWKLIWRLLKLVAVIALIATLVGVFVRTFWQAVTGHAHLPDGGIKVLEREIKNDVEE